MTITSTKAMRPTMGIAAALVWSGLFLAGLAAPTPALSQSAGAVGQPPAVNQPVTRPAVQPLTGPQYVREPIVKADIVEDPAVQQARQQLASLDKQIAELKPQDSQANLAEQRQLRLQKLMDRRAKAQETLSNLLKKQSDNSQQIIDNIK